MVKWAGELNHSSVHLFIVGRYAAFILKNKIELLRIFINVAIERCKETNQFANKKIKNVDKKRSSYYNYYTKQQFGDARYLFK